MKQKINSGFIKKYTNNGSSLCMNWSDFEINYEYLIVITMKHCYIYQIDSITTPQIIPLKSHNIIYSMLSTEAFCILVNSLNGINVNCRI